MFHKYIYLVKTVLRSHQNKHSYDVRLNLAKGCRRRCHLRILLILALILFTGAEPF